jgi:preprotein translocase subunit SecG
LLTYILYGLFILSCIVLVVTVLLQPGKADAGALFSSGVSSTAFGPRGTQSILAKITIGAAAAYMLIGLTLGLPIITGQRSVLQSVSEEPVPAATPVPSPAKPAEQPAPAATQPATGSATPAASPAAGTSPAAKK